MITPVILSGGNGSRLWPLSTPDRPKQFLPLVGDRTLFDQTLARVSDRQKYAAPIVVGSARHEQLCLEGLRDVEDSRLILEPISRNTAVAIVMAAAVIAEHDPDEIMLVMPSDQLIGDTSAFHRAVQLGRECAQKGMLVTFGIQPTGPETGFGYIQARTASCGSPGLFQVERFKEKPNLSTAKAMISAGNHYWNGGIFMFRAGRFLQECAALDPAVHELGVQAVAESRRDGALIWPDRSSLDQCPNISIDYAVMERSDSIAMVPLDAEWSDVGSWDALAEIEAVAESRKVTAVDSNNCFVRTDGLEIALLGVSDLIVVGQGNQVAIIKRGRSQDIKGLAALAAND